MKDCKTCLEDLIPLYDGIGDKTDFVCHNSYCKNIGHIKKVVVNIFLIKLDKTVKL